MFNASLNKCFIQAIQATSLRCSKRCYSSNIILEENNLPPITYCLFSSTYFHCKMLGIPYAAFKCSLTAAITLTLCASEFPISYYQWQTFICWTGSFHLLWHWSKKNIASSSKNKEGREAWHIFTYHYISKLSKDMQSGSKLCSWLMFSKNVNESEKSQ